MSLIAWIVICGVMLVGIVGLAIPSISRRRNLLRAQECGAIWVGMANFEALRPGSDPAVQAAFLGVGSMYGARFAGKPTRPVGGLLFVRPSGLRWEPRIWLGRGDAKPWSLDRASIVNVDIRSTPFPAVRSFDAQLRTTRGDASFKVVDPAGLRSAILTMLASAA